MHKQVLSGLDVAGYRRQTAVKTSQRREIYKEFSQRRGRIYPRISRTVAIPPLRKFGIFRRSPSGLNMKPGRFSSYVDITMPRCWFSYTVIANLASLNFNAVERLCPFHQGEHLGATAHKGGLVCECCLTCLKLPLQIKMNKLDSDRLLIVGNDCGMSHEPFCLLYPPVKKGFGSVSGATCSPVEL